MKRFLDKALNHTQHQICKAKQELHDLEECEIGFTMRNARYGAVIPAARWDSLFDKRFDLNEEIEFWERVDAELRKENHIYNSDKPAMHYVTVLEGRAMKIFSDKDQFEKCIKLRDFISFLKEQINPTKTTGTSNINPQT